MDVEPHKANLNKAKKMELHKQTQFCFYIYMAVYENINYVQQNSTLK